MTTQREIAQFYRLALPLDLVNTTAVERWADSVIVAQSVACYPFTELAVASLMRVGLVDELLEQVAGDCQLHVPGRTVLALLRRRLRDRTLAPEAAIALVSHIGFTGALHEAELRRADGLDDSVWLAANGSYGNLDDVRQRIAEFFDRYAEFDGLIPTIA